MEKNQRFKSKIEDPRLIFVTPNDLNKAVVERSVVIRRMNVRTTKYQIDNRAEKLFSVFEIIYFR